jgi:hypothetical protein
MFNLNLVNMANQHPLNVNKATNNLDSFLQDSSDMKKFSWFKKLSMAIGSGLLSLSLVTSHTSIASATIDQSSSANTTCQTTNNVQPCNFKKTQSRKLIAYSDARLAFSWRAAPFETVQILIESIRNGNIVGLGMVMLSGNDVYIVKPKLVNTGDVPVRIHPWNMKIHYGNSYARVLPINDSRFMQPDILKVGYQVEGLVAFIAPSGLNIPDDITIGYYDDSIQID